METMRGVYQEETWKNRDRRYRRMSEKIKVLRKENRISSASPKTMTVEDVRQYILYAQESLSPADMVHEVNALRKLLLYARNSAVDICLQENPRLKPSVRGRSRNPPMEEDDLDLIFRRAESIPEDDFIKYRAYTLVCLVLATGCRNKEIRFADVKDLDTRNWVLDIIHVKGERSYGSPRRVPIPPEVRKIVETYLFIRHRYVFESALKCDALFPSKESRDGYLCGNSIRRMKDLVEEDLGIRFDLRQCRRTFGQRYIDKGLDLESVSVLMGHSSTKTTERFYGRRKNDQAIEKARSMWNTEG